MEEVEKVQHIVRQEEGVEEIILKDVMTRAYYDDFDTEIAYIITNYFRKYEEDTIDYDYIKRIWPKFYQYRDIVRDLVNIHTVSFGYDDMDMIDRVIFVLGYVEYLEIKTPKEVVINEMVELAKRYGDDKSSKLINGIGHKVLSAMEWSVDTPKE